MQECNQYNEKGERHGYWEVYWDSSNLWYKGTYLNGVEDGYWERYWSDGTLWYKGKYKNGEMIGYWIINNEEYYYATM